MYMPLFWVYSMNYILTSFENRDREVDQKNRNRGVDKNLLGKRNRASERKSVRKQKRFCFCFRSDAKEEFVTELPQQVTVELTPRSSAAWLKVHNLSQNPRVRFQVSVNRSLVSLMDHLCKKWTGPDDRVVSFRDVDDNDSNSNTGYLYSTPLLLALNILQVFAAGLLVSNFIFHTQSTNTLTSR